MSSPITEAVRARRSIKDFLATPIERKTIEALLELAVFAPNHRMTQPWRFIVLGAETRAAYAAIKAERSASNVEDPVAAEAVRAKTLDYLKSVPAMVAFIQRLDDDPAIREEDFATIYMGIQNVLLGALEKDIGTHVRTGALLDEPHCRSALGVREGERIVALVFLGGPASTPGAKPRVLAAERTRWLP